MGTRTSLTLSVFRAQADEHWVKSSGKSQANERAVIPREPWVTVSQEVAEEDRQMGKQWHRKVSVRKSGRASRKSGTWFL